MRSVREATGKKYESMLSSTRAPQGIFDEADLERAEAIAKILDGMTVASAKELLGKLEAYLLDSVFTFCPDKETMA